MKALLRNIGGLFSLATVLAAIVTLTAYLISRHTGSAAFFDQHWSLIVSATGLLTFGLIVAVRGVMLLYSVDDTFASDTVPTGVAIIVVGLALLAVGLGVLLNL